MMINKLITTRSTMLDHGTGETLISRYGARDSLEASLGLLGIIPRSLRFGSEVIAFG